MRSSNRSEEFEKFYKNFPLNCSYILFCKKKSQREAKGQHEVGMYNKLLFICFYACFVM